jgi:hypothetical protein
MLDEWFLLNSKLNIGDWIPWLNFLDLQGYVKRMKALTKKFDQFYDHVFDDHKVKRGVGDFVPNDMVDLLLQLVDDPNTVVKLTYDNVKGLTQVYVDLSRGFFLLLLLLFDIYLLNHCFLYKFKNLL